LVGDTIILVEEKPVEINAKEETTLIPDLTEKSNSSVSQDNSTKSTSDQHKEPTLQENHATKIETSKPDDTKVLETTNDATVKTVKDESKVETAKMEETKVEVAKIDETNETTNAKHTSDSKVETAQTDDAKATLIEKPKTETTTNQNGNGKKNKRNKNKKKK